MEEARVLPFFLVKNHDSSLANMRRTQGSSALRVLDVGQGLSEVSYASRNSILELSSAEDRVNIAQAISSMRYKFQSLKKLDIAFRAVDGALLVELLSSTACQAAHSRFPFSLDMLCDMKLLRQCASTVTALDLTGASIPPHCLHQLLALCPQLEFLSLGGLILTEEVFTLEKPMMDLQVLSLNGCGGLGEMGCISAVLKMAPNVINLDMSMSDVGKDGLLHLVSAVNAKLEALAVSHLGQRFTEEHLQLLTGRCHELIHLDLSSTLAVHYLNAAHYTSLPNLETLMASMMCGPQSPITAETLMGFDVLPALKTLIIHRRITNEEVQRFAPWHLKFVVVRSGKRRMLEDAAGVVCRMATQECGSEFPRAQTGLRMQHSSSEPL